jgi:hypothetical protein
MLAYFSISGKWSQTKAKQDKGGLMVLFRFILKPGIKAIFTGNYALFAQRYN